MSLIYFHGFIDIDDSKFNWRYSNLSDPRFHSDLIGQKIMALRVTEIHFNIGGNRKLLMSRQLHTS